MLQILISKITLLEQNLFKSKLILKFDKKNQITSLKSKMILLEQNLFKV